MHIESHELTLEPFQPEDEEALYVLFKEVVENEFFPYKSSSKDEFQRQFLAAGSKIYVCRSPSGEIIGGFYVRSNAPDRSEGLANASYMVHQAYRGRGIGKWLVKRSLVIAKAEGFHTMQFNKVLKQNKRALALYFKLGFRVFEELPSAYKMERKLEDII